MSTQSADRTVLNCMDSSPALRKQQRHYPTCETCMSTTSFSIPITSRIRHALICVLILVYLTKSLLEYTPVQRLRHGIIKLLSFRISCIGVSSHRMSTFSGSFTRTLIVPFRHISAGFAQSIYAPKETYLQIVSDIREIDSDMLSFKRACQIIPTCIISFSFTCKP